MIRKEWVVWFIFFLMAGIGTYFIYEQEVHHNDALKDNALKNLKK